MNVQARLKGFDVYLFEQIKEKYPFATNSEILVAAINSYVKECFTPDELDQIKENYINRHIKPNL